MAYWLMKSEPTVFGIEHLQARGVALWDGVRNYQARNFLRQMQVGDEALFYHSNCAVPGIVGRMRIARAGYPDPTQFSVGHAYYDPASPPDNPRWTGVDVEFVQRFSQAPSLAELRLMPELAELALLRKGNRLSLMPMTDAQWQAVLQRCS